MSLGHTLVLVSCLAGVVTGGVLYARDRSSTAIFVGTVGVALLVYFVGLFLLT